MAEGKLVSATIGFGYLRKLEGLMDRHDVTQSQAVKLALISFLEKPEKEQDEIFYETLTIAMIHELGCTKLRLLDQAKHIDQETFDLKEKKPGK